MSELTPETIRKLQAENARQVHAEWVAAGKPGARYALQYQADGAWFFVLPETGDALAEVFSWEQTQNFFRPVVGARWRAVPYDHVPMAWRKPGHLRRPLSPRVELAPGYAPHWLTCVAMCGWLSGVVATEVFGHSPSAMNR